MDLFESSRQDQIAREAPLAHRMRPRTFDEFAGQAHIIGPGRLLRRAIEADQLTSIVLWGPPGCGKTTLANLIAERTASHFVTLNAVLDGVKELRAVIEAAQERRNLYGKRTVLFVDEIHRWNKAQQDALLPHVERGLLILVGATTENPFFEIVGPLLSRSRVFEMQVLSDEDLRAILDQALRDPSQGYGRRSIQIEDEAAAHLIRMADGDARALLNALELAVVTTPPGADGAIRIDLNVAQESIQRRTVRYDKGGDEHYDTISAFIKSIRGSDPDAALFWLGKMIIAGEDPRFILRRLLILCGEDVGLADPQGIVLVNACAQGFDRIGMPEGIYLLGLATLYLATAPKSNSVGAIFSAMERIESGVETEVPLHLRTSPRNRSKDDPAYLYPHDHPNHYVEQLYLPASLGRPGWYQPGNLGHEQRIRAWFYTLKGGQHTPEP